MKNNVFFLFVFFLFGITNVLWGQGIVVNEVQSSNKATIKDESGNYEDWIELYNKGLAYVNLSGYGLSDDQSMLFKWIFPNVLLGPDQYLLIWASGKNRAVSGSHLHTNFKLNSSGGVIVLTDPSGVKIDEVSVKELVPDVSYGRLPNGIGDFVFFDKCTPNTVNFSNGYSEILKPPEFSKNSGFYSQGFDLSLSTSDPGVIILYTLDGSEPDSHTLDGTNTTYNYKNQYPENPGQLKGALYTKTYETLKYNVPITISDRSSLPNKIASISSTYHFDPYYIPEVPILKGTVVRARAMKPGALSSYVVTKNYFVSPKIKDRFSLPVISLSISEDELFDYYKGIYVAGVDFDNWRDANPTVKPGSKEGIGNYYRKKDEDERLANLSYFVNGEEILNQDIGIAIHGGGSRIHQSKSLGVYARSKYGDNTLNFKFFSDIDNVHFKRLILKG